MQFYYVDIARRFRGQKRRDYLFAGQILEMTDGRGEYNVGMCTPLESQVPIHQFIEDLEVLPVHFVDEAISVIQFVDQRNRAQS